MNNVATSKEKLLEMAQQIVFQDGIDCLSIRTLANKLNISVGTVYNYFPSKADLLLAIVENFWKQVFHKDICAQSENFAFPEFYELVYHRLSDHMEIFYSILLGQMDLLREQDREKGKALEARYLEHIQKGFYYALKQDHSIQTIWNAEFSKEDFIQFVFEHMMNDLSHGRKDCTYMKEIIHRLLQSS